MKKISILLAVFVTLAAFSSCLSDLDTVPLDERDFTAERAYDDPEAYKMGLVKIYGNFVLVGSGAGSGDISGIDAGRSELNRTQWNLQEATTDAAKLTNTNSRSYEVNTMSWSAVQNDIIYAHYSRIIVGVANANEYLRQTTPGKLAGRGIGKDDPIYQEVMEYRGEVKFLRAYMWWLGLNSFGYLPFITENDEPGAFAPRQIEPKELFEYIEKQLTDLIEDEDEEFYLKNPGQNAFPRVDKTAAYAVLARLYLNAQQFTDKAYWAEAKTMAEKAIAGPYKLAEHYASLFCGDNSTNPDARQELIFATAYDDIKTKSYGGASFIIAGVMPSGDTEGKDLINSDGWGTHRMDQSYALNNFDISNIDYDNGTFDCDDNRAMFWIKGRSGSITALNDVMQGWAVTKFTNRSFLTGQKTGTGVFTSTYWPQIRLAEMYLIYAEATLRAGTGPSSTDTKSLDYLNALRQRALGANYTALSSFDQDYILKERARELMWEGHRRTDLKRYGYFTSGLYRWPWKGGVLEGAGVDDKYKWFAKPESDLNLNPNLTNPGY